MQFFTGQLKCLITTKNVYFANVLDGDEAANNMEYHYLMDIYETKNNIYVGDLMGYIKWFETLFNSSTELKDVVSLDTVV